MRGNELGVTLRRHHLGLLFPIPMRGNEWDDVRDWWDVLEVPDPHEG